jgi:hypothetical protein
MLQHHFGTELFRKEYRDDIFTVYVLSIVAVVVFLAAHGFSIGNIAEAYFAPASESQTEDSVVSPSDKATATEQVEWKAFINYGGGYRVENECGKVIASDLSSAVVIRQARRKAKKLQKQVRVTYWAETPDGVEAERPFGPSGL